MEKLKFIGLVNFLDKYNILNENQFSFRSGRSTTQAYLPVTDKIQRAIENELYSCGIFALFDTVDHNIFFAKLDQYGIRGLPNNCFRSYLTNRQQTNSDSDLLQMTYGVPKGSVLGPVLLLIYINEFINSSSIFDFPFLDDDSNLQFLLQQQKLESPLQYSVTVCSVCRCT